jgi:hypothetical protein
MAEKKKFLLRVDAALFSALEKWAADDLRSINAQIEFLLTEAARRASRLKPPAMSAGSTTDDDPPHS